MENQNKEIKSGYVTIIGRPNAGKSTLMNRFLGEKISIITNKPQTTRKRVLGILDDENYQIIFLDTPGILNPAYLLQKKMLEYVFQSINDADVLLVLIDISTDPTGELTFANEDAAKLIEKFAGPKIAAINKVDISSEDKVNSLMVLLEDKNIFDEIVPISATEGYNTSKLLDILIDKLPVHPKYFPEDQISDEPERFFVSEIIREKIFEQYKDEIPYSTEVLIENFKEREKGKDFIAAVIVVEKDSQKPIIIGRKGEALKKLGQRAREEIERFLQRPVYLELRVKVRKNWRQNPALLKSFGYIQSND
jgi:GTP-binding protein Era